jgi:hypothetical protein
VHVLRVQTIGRDARVAAFAGRSQLGVVNVKAYETLEDSWISREANPPALDVADAAVMDLVFPNSIKASPQCWTDLRGTTIGQINSLEDRLTN